MKNDNSTIIRAGGNFYIMLTVLSSIMLMFIIWSVIDCIIRAEYTGLLQLIFFLSAVPVSLYILAKWLRVKITDDEISIRQLDAFAHRMRIVDIGQAVEDRHGSSGTLYAMAHALIVYPKSEVGGKELVINLKPYKDEDVQRLFAALRKRGVPGKYGEHPTPHRRP